MDARTSLQHLENLFINDFGDMFYHSPEVPKGKIEKFGFRLHDVDKKFGEYINTESLFLSFNKREMVFKCIPPGCQITRFNIQEDNRSVRYCDLIFFVEFFYKTEDTQYRESMEYLINQLEDYAKT